MGTALDPVDASSFDTSTPIKGVVHIVKENRSFGHLFGRFPGANGVTVGIHVGLPHPAGERAGAHRGMGGRGDPTTCRMPHSGQATHVRSQIEPPAPTGSDPGAMDGSSLHSVGPSAASRSRLRYLRSVRRLCQFDRRSQVVGEAPPT